MEGDAWNDLILPPLVETSRNNRANQEAKKDDMRQQAELAALRHVVDNRHRVGQGFGACEAVMSSEIVWVRRVFMDNLGRGRAKKVKYGCRVLESKSMF